MAALNSTNTSAVLKSLYPDGLDEALYQMEPLWGLIEKVGGFEGDGLYIPLKFAPTAGGSVDFATAKANKNPSQLKRFQITRKFEYQLASITTEMQLATKSNKGAFMEAFKMEMDSAIYAFGRAVAAGLYGNGGGALGQVSSGQTGATVTLTDPFSVVNFEYGMYVQSATTDGTSGSVNSGQVQIGNIVRDNTTSTVKTKDGSNWNAAGNIPAIAANDYLFRAGDFGAKITGLNGWVPTSAPTSTLFNGVDRTVDTRLGGLRITGSGNPKEEVLIDALQLCAINGVSPDLVVVHPQDNAGLLKALGAKTFIDIETDKPTVSYRSYSVAGPKGDVSVVSSSNCPKGDFYCLTRDTWAVHYLGDGVPFVINLDGNKMLREDSADAIEFRLAGMLELGCTYPGANLHGTW